MSTAKIEIYSKGWCPYCFRAKNLLKAEGLDYTEYDVSNDPDRFQEMLDRSGGKMTVPQIFINEVHVGGSDELAAAKRNGQLAELIGAD